MASGKMRICTFADVQIFEMVKCTEILYILPVDVTGKMQMWQRGYMICHLHGTFALNIVLYL